MEIVSVKIKGTVSSVQYGNLSSGTILKNIPAEYGKHLVDCDAAVYVTDKQVKLEQKREQKNRNKPKKAPEKARQTLMERAKKLIS